MTPEPINIVIKHNVRLELSMVGDEVVASLTSGGRQASPSVRATANSERVFAKDGGLHISRSRFEIPESERRAVADFLKAVQAAS